MSGSTFPIDQSAYSDLFFYTVFFNNIVDWNESTSGGVIIANSGSWGYNTLTSQTGTVTPNSADNTNAANAITDFIGLYSTILGFGSFAPSTYTIDSTLLQGTVSNLTLESNKIYTTTNLIGNTIELTFSKVSGNDEFFIIVNGSLDFTDVTLTLGPGVFASNIYWLITGTCTITESSVGTNIIYGNFLMGSNPNGIFRTNNTLITGNIYSASGESTTFNYEDFNNNITNITGITNVCFLKGTKILTETGYKLIEDLKVGDKIITKGEINNDDSIDKKSDYSIEPLIWLGKFSPIKLNKASLPICIKKNAFGENLPCEDLYVSPLHRIILFGKMIAAENLVNGETIFQDTSKKSLVYYHLELPKHYCIIANGILSETYKDFDNRHVFEKNNISLPNEIINLQEIVV